MPRFALYEDGLAGQFSPIALLRPVFELRCGHFTVRERWENAFGGPQVERIEWGAVLRPILVDAYREERPHARVNDFGWLAQQPTLLVNGRWLGDPQELSGLGRHQVAYAAGELAALWIEPDQTLSGDIDQLGEELKLLARGRDRIEVGGMMAHYPWDLVRFNARLLRTDFEGRVRYDTPPLLDDRVALLGDQEAIHISPTAQIDPFVVIDARQGPVWIDDHARIQAFTRLEGPCFIGAQTLLFRANIRAGCSIGPVCRVGGEVEESIFHSHANKYHDGFVGHSYLCPWVNLGAQTTNSDLKNDYSCVRVPLAGAPIDTGETKVGCFIGDHTKTALCSLFNTGSSVGVMCQILPAGELLPKHIPAFTRLWHGRLEEIPQGVDACITVARVAMNRRQQQLTSSQEELLRRVYEGTAPERAAALNRAAHSR